MQFVDDLPPTLHGGIHRKSTWPTLPARDHRPLRRADLAAGMWVSAPARRCASCAFGSAQSFAYATCYRCRRAARDTLRTVSAERLYAELDGLLLAPGAGKRLRSTARFWAA